MLDGPALRANALITWANYLLVHGNISYVTSSLWPVIKLDLDYVASDWNQTTQASYITLFAIVNPFLGCFPALTCGRRYHPRPFSPPPFNIAHCVKALLLLLLLVRPPLFQVTQLRQTTFCVSSKSVMLSPAMNHCLCFKCLPCSHIGTRQVT